MTKLKTLKDLRFNIKEKDKNMKELMDIIQDFFHQDIKKEAIKWVKYYRTLNHGAQIPELLGESPSAKALIDFCNITEADLTDKDDLK